MVQIDSMAHPVVSSLVVAVAAAVLFAIAAAVTDKPRNDKVTRQHVALVAVIVFAVSLGVRYMMEPHEELMQLPFRDAPAIV